MSKNYEVEYEFRAGDVVQLKSGGNPMTVEGYSQVGAVMVAWYDGKSPQKAAFAESALKLFEQPSRKVAW